MNNQEIFDFAVNHMRKQKVKSANRDEHNVYTYCLYRDESGNKCAVGCLIPDEHYSKDMDDTNNPNKGSGILVNKKVQKVLVDHLNIDLEVSMGLLSDLQYIHDRIYKEWCSVQETEAENIANQYNLIYTYPEN